MDVDESVSGFEVRGYWGTVVELWERITRALREAGGEYVFEVNVNDDEVKAEVSNLHAEYADEADRRHLDVEVDASSVEATEDVEITG